MAVIDFNTSTGYKGLRPNVIIIGAGAAGLFLASKLSAQFSVLLVESGSLAVDQETQQLNAVQQTGKHMLSAVDGRKRAVGGTTVAWGGQSLPFSELDFEVRPWVPKSGWPFTAAELHSHYANANQAMGIDTLNYDSDIFSLLGSRHLSQGFDQSLVRFHFSKWAPEPNFRKVFARQIETAFTVLRNCVFINVRCEGPNLRGIVCRNHAGQQEHIECDRLIIAAGGLESTRIMLWLQSRHGFLTRSQESVLGSRFMEHPSLEVGMVAGGGEYRWQRAFNTQLCRRRKYSLRLSAADDWQSRQKALNVTAAVSMRYRGDSFDPYVEFRTFSNLWAKKRRLGQTFAAYLGTAYGMTVDGFVFKRGATAGLSLCCEQEPDNGSRLSLGSERDRFGIPRLSIDWRVSEFTWRTIAEFAHTLKAEFGRLNLPAIELRPELLADESRPDLLHDIGHHMGGTVMGSVTSETVVDVDLKIRGLNNAWVCSASVFPTSSHSNPTLTVLALADRLADHLIRRS